jgi:hypothetical protein
MLSLAIQKKRPNALKELAGIREEFHLNFRSHTAGEYFSTGDEANINVRTFA